ncbi:hypothetical protein [Gemmatimonas sp.]|uniref:hypothetical protein n=1 Tax=Gemmatimonas sp. TaxID=1962908 RepID=UPI00356B3D78
MDRDVPSPPVRLTREELYERVWSEASATLGPKLGLSDTGLRKICAKFSIPTPPRGYWAKVAAGQRPRRTPMLKLATGAKGHEVAVFHQPPRPTAQAVAQAFAADPSPTGVQRRFEAQPEHRIVVPEILEAPHPLVAASVLLLRRAKIDEDLRVRSGGLKCVALKLTLSSVDRALRIYDALFKALGQRGHRVELATTDAVTRTVVHIGADAIGLEITEQVRRTEVPPLKAVTGWYAKRYAYEATGALTLELTTPYLPIRGKWSDGGRQQLDELLNDVIVALVAAAEALTARRAEAERVERERQAAEARRRDEEERRRRENARIRALQQDVQCLQQCRAVRDYVATMREAATAAGLPLDDALLYWLAWAEHHADDLDPAKALTVPTDPTPHADARHPWSPSSPEPERSWWQRPWYNR